MYGAPIVDPIQLLGKLDSTPAICISLFGLMLATLTTNIAANIVATANALANISPKYISFTTGGHKTMRTIQTMAGAGWWGSFRRGGKGWLRIQHPSSPAHLPQPRPGEWAQPLRRPC
jgi:hypothetical protein